MLCSEGEILGLRTVCVVLDFGSVGKRWIYVVCDGMHTLVVVVVVVIVVKNQCCVYQCIVRKRYWTEGSSVRGSRFWEHGEKVDVNCL